MVPAKGRMPVRARLGRTGMARPRRRTHLCMDTSMRTTSITVSRRRVPQGTHTHTLARIRRVTRRITLRTRLAIRLRHRQCSMGMMRGLQGTKTPFCYFYFVTTSSFFSSSDFGLSWIISQHSIDQHPLYVLAHDYDFLVLLVTAFFIISHHCMHTVSHSPHHAHAISISSFACSRSYNHHYSTPYITYGPRHSYTKFSLHCI